MRTTPRTRAAPAAALLLLFPLVALLAPLLAHGPSGGPGGLRAPIPWDPGEPDLDARLRPPGADHWLGTDDLGRDVLARLVHGARVSTGVGLLAAALSIAVGALAGALAGVAGGATDRGVLFLVEVVQAFPPLVLVAAGAAFFPPAAATIAVLVAATSWPDSARLVRAQARRLVRAPFVDAARAGGASATRILFRHVLPGALAPALATAPYVLGAAVLTEAGLSFLGLGTPPPAPSWGRALADARESLGSAWWCAAAPAAALFLFVLSARRLGDALSGRGRG